MICMWLRGHRIDVLLLGARQYSRSRLTACTPVYQLFGTTMDINSELLTTAKLTDSDILALGSKLIAKRRSYRRFRRTMASLVWVLLIILVITFPERVACLFPFVAVLGSLAVGTMFIRPPRTSRIVVWLRRFHNPDIKEFPFGEVLTQICRGIAIPVTLQDSMVDTSDDLTQSSFGRSASGYSTGCGLDIARLAVVLIVAGVAGVMIHPVVGLVTFVGVSFGARHLIDPKKRTWMRRNGVMRLSEKGGVEQVDRLTAKIHTDQGSRQPFLVLGVPDAIWQRIVTQWVQAADAVVMDITEISEHMIWEMHQCKALLAPEQIIFAYGYHKYNYVAPGEDILPPRHRAVINEIWGEGPLSRFSLFTYLIPSTPEHGLFSPKRYMRETNTKTKRLYKPYDDELVYLMARAFQVADTRGDKVVEALPVDG